MIRAAAIGICKVDLLSAQRIFIHDSANAPFFAPGWKNTK
jgi:hypothetical protein